MSEHEITPVTWKWAQCVKKRPKQEKEAKHENEGKMISVSSMTWSSIDDATGANSPYIYYYLYFYEDVPHCFWISLLYMKMYLKD